MKFLHGFFFYNKVFSDFWNITRTREIKLGYYLCVTKFYMQSNFSYITFMHEENFLFKLVAMPVKSCFFFRVHTFQNMIITNLQSTDQFETKSLNSLSKS